jgi:hypothetical protein
MSMNFNCTKLHLHKYTSTRLVSLKQNMNFNFHPATTFVFLFLTKNVLFKIIHPFKIYQRTKLHGSKLNSASFASTSVVWAPSILEGLKMQG